jgi:two-component system chemotaxis response regulator CheY
MDDAGERACEASGIQMKTCLVVEDSAVLRQIAARLLRELGVEPREAATAEAGLEACRAARPDAVLLDWDLPSLAALDFLRGVAGLDASERPVIILVATENDHQQFTLAKAAGAAHHILKPFDLETLRGKLAEIGVLPAAPGVANRAAS